MRLPDLQPTTTWLQRLLAVVCIGLVGFLGIAGSSAELHARIHADNSAHADGHEGQPANSHEQGCVIDLFAQGVSFSIEMPRVAVAGEIGESLFQTVAEQAAPTKPAGWLPPPCGPPLK
ncbi:hypothetical protein [Oleiharenicola lentus]|uniref:hypothetical protein n=1 Tax=Oleiharenicola lentus TaxID=2508720 RepID=UPI003F679011